ncbi:hypothetical protein COW46_00840 [Candidatus Gracilibacteria bacterium CG17_big_fil_post_rev_8_21_14_2_50_48_13]|nr:MAG: hypothetical protein COW46_00840 [Candidatus Gracilibacteria bacterium CG17_big_fil_post_rev_8_21_14_2_50_48_13]
MIPFWEALDAGVKRIGLILPRRSGKTVTSVNATFRDMYERQGAHFHYFPTYKQGRTVVWDGMDGNGNRFLDHLPKELVYARNNQEMILTSRSTADLAEPGSVYRIIGSDNIDRSVGSNPVWTLFDEYSLSDPIAWDYVRPILAENGGTAIFIFTPRGKNHAYRLYQSTKDDPNWFWMRLTVDDTAHIPKAVLEQERKEIIAKNGDDALFWQEYYCDFDAPVQGAIYGTMMREIETEGRVRDVPHDKALVVHTSWDLGRGDNTVVWFVQLDPFGEYRVIDHYANKGHNIEHYFEVLKKKERELGYYYGGHYLPHDASAERIDTKKTVEQMMADWFPARDIHVVPRVARKFDRIQLVRQMLRRCYFDTKRTEPGREALVSYHYVWDEKRMQFKDEPEHDWASDHADAFGQIFQYIYPRKAGGSRSFAMEHDPYK